MEKDIGFLLHKADMAAKNNLTCRFNDFGITPGQYSVLQELYNYGKTSGIPSLRPACIAERLKCDRPTMTGIIERLEGQGWIMREENPEDKRSCMICLTQKALENLKALDSICTEHQKRVLEGFTEEEAVLFRDFLCRVMDNF